MKEKTASQTEIPAVEIPTGHFGGNCSDCCFAEWSDRKDDGRVHCGKGMGYNYPSERNGCIHYKYCG